MAKRFRDTLIWNKVWYCDLTPKMKCAWDFLCDNCDHAGIWDENYKLMSFQIGDTISQNEIFEAFGNKLVKIKNKIFIPRFIDFQYGHLNQANRVHKSVINRLKLIGAYEGLTSPLQGCTATATDKDKAKDKDKEKEKEGFSQTSTPATPGDVESCYNILKGIPTWSDKFRPLIEREISKLLMSNPNQDLISEAFSEGCMAFANTHAVEPCDPKKFINSLRRHVIVSIGNIREGVINKRGPEIFDPDSERA